MMILLTAALAAALPAAEATPVQESRAQQMAPMGKPEQADCCPCKDMAEKHQGHVRQEGQSGQ